MVVHKTLKAPTITFADEAARLADVAVYPENVVGGLLAVQNDTRTVYVLSGVNPPVWTATTPSIEGVSVLLDADQTVNVGTQQDWVFGSSLGPLNPLVYNLDLVGSPTNVEVQKTGTYITSLHATVSRVSGAARLAHYLLRNDGTVYTQVKGTEVYTSSNSAIRLSSASATVVLGITAGDRLAVASLRVSGTGTVNLLSNGCVMTLLRIK